MKTTSERELRSRLRTGAEPVDCSLRGEARAVAEESAAMRILIVCSVRLLRDGLQSLFEVRPRVASVCGVATSDEALSKLRTYDASLILIDLTSPDRLDLARHLSTITPRLQVLGFAASEREHDVLAYAEAGITAFVSSDASHEELLEAIDRAARGELLCSPHVAGTLFRRVAALAGVRQSDSALSSLTGREREVVHFIDEGLSNKEIARSLRIGVSTVKNHVHRILEKLQVRRRGEAAARLRQ